MNNIRENNNIESWYVVENLVDTRKYKLDVPEGFLMNEDCS